MSIQGESVITAKEAAALLGVSYQHFIRKLRTQRIVPYRQAGAAGTITIDRDDFDRAFPRRYGPDHANGETRA